MKIALKSLAAAVVLAGASQALAADIEATPIDDTKNGYMIFVFGEISPGDHEKFSRLAAQYDRAIVILNSPGGSTIEAIEIGKAIRIREYPTVVLEKSKCESACALIWLAGKKRYLEGSAKVGFHATYFEENGIAKESGPGNALVGNYLSLFNLSQDAIFYVSSAPPDQLNYVSLTNASQVGIDVSEFAPKEDNNNNQSGDTAEYAHFTNWSVRVDRTLGEGCFAYISYQDGLAIRLGYDARSTVYPYIVLFGTHWNSVKPKDKYKISIQVDGSAAWTDEMSGVNMDGLKGLAVSLKDDDLIKEISQGKLIRIYYQGKYIDGGPLTGSAEAVASVHKCQREQDLKRDPFHR